jgi:branched-subunit amino acid transport protein
MSDIVVLAVLLWAVTYPARAVGLLAPGVERLPRVVLDYLRLVGPAVLTALGVVNVAVVVDEANRSQFHIGLEWVAVAACGAITVWRRNFMLGLIVAIAIMTLARLVGIA